MKFEKFLKRVGSHGLIYTRANGDRWLVCDGVGMIIPVGVTNLLGDGTSPDTVKKLVDGLVRADVDDKVYLSRAEITADGKTSDIIRVFGNGVFEDEITIEVGINNADFGLIEKADSNLAEVEIEDSGISVLDGKYLVILDRNDEVIGFIQGVSDI